MCHDPLSQKFSFAKKIWAMQKEEKKKNIDAKEHERKKEKRKSMLKSMKEKKKEINF